MAGMVQLISDVHCDISGRELSLRPTASTLVIAGDVCPFVDKKYRDYMAAITANHRNVAYVPGNHEHYGSPDQDGPGSVSLQYMDRVCRSLPSNVVLLHSGGHHLDVPGSDVRIVGATMWTNVEPRYKKELDGILNDFSHIKFRGGPFNADAMNRAHDRDRDWVEACMDSARRHGKAALVVTHHSPDRRLSVFNAEKSTNGFGPMYYSSDLGGLTSKRAVAGWCYGHTHEAHVLRLLGSSFPFITNAYGYPGQRTGYADGFAINFSTRK